jgi:hypothetical protein
VKKVRETHIQLANYTQPEKSLVAKETAADERRRPTIGPGPTLARTVIEDLTLHSVSSLQRLLIQPAGLKASKRCRRCGDPPTAAHSVLTSEDSPLTTFQLGQSILAYGRRRGAAREPAEKVGVGRQKLLASKRLQIERGIPEIIEKV